MDQEKVIVIDFGGQYNQLVARRVRECNVYCEIYSYKIDIEKIKEMNPKGIILTGGPNSCYEENSPSYQKELFELGIPVLGICYGAQLMMHKLGGKVITPEVGEYGKTEITYSANGVMFKDLPSESVCWMSHFDRIAEAAPGFEVVAYTADCPIAATQNVEKKLYAVQFHPEVLHTKNGTQMIYNFVRGVCGCAGDWKMDAFVENTVKEIREKVGVLFGSPETTSGGRALKFYSTIRLDIRRVDQIKQGTEAIGNLTRIKVVKNKVAPPFKIAEVDLIYGKGISYEGEVLDLATNLDIVEKSGSWFSYNGERLGQGRETVKELLRQNPELAKEIELKVREKIIG